MTQYKHVDERCNTELRIEEYEEALQISIEIPNARVFLAVHMTPEMAREAAKALLSLADELAAIGL